MNLISCDGCGVVLDKGKLNFPDADMSYNEDGSPQYDKLRWGGAAFTPYVHCPVCKNEILETDYE